ncbi:MAG: hypothetical protein Q8S09_16380 [Hyphomonas sp.]|nr:hypothetical protein [Hyphomonas sp.]
MTNVDTLPDPGHSTASTAREKLVEHLFVGAVLRHLWIAGHRDAEVLRSEFDARGYDLVIEAGGVMRHIQLKSSAIGARTANVSISRELARKPAGCVVWVWFDAATLEFGPLLWFGGRPGEPLPDLGDRVAMHTKGNSLGEKTQRPNHRVLTKAQFRRLDGIGDLIAALYGADITG